MKIGDLIRWKRNSFFGSLYPEEVGVIFKVTDKASGFVHVHWIQSSRRMFEQEHLIWPLSCLEVAEK